MKRVSDYSEKELLAFEDDQLSKLIEIECMVEGVEEVPPPGDEPAFGGDLKTKNFYRLGGNLLFPTAESANEASKLATHELEYTSLNGKYAAKEKRTDTVSVDTFYDYKELSAVKADKDSFDKVHSQWEKRNRAYDEYCRKRDKAESRVYDAVNSARETIGEENKRLAQYQRYVELAEDKNIAGKFFVEMLTKQGWSDDDARKELLRVNPPTESSADE